MAGRFLHGVASGDPTASSVVLWTRVTADEPALTVAWEIATDTAFDDVVASGTTAASQDRDHTVHVDVTGLASGTQHHYRFSAAGETSPAGRTRTLPATGATNIRLATASCAKFNAGFFNAYQQLAARDDLDLVVHLGDYIYEASNTPPKSQTPGADIGRPFDPLHECKTLQDYRTRYAQYRSDPDVQALHAAHPIVATMDDHELADGAWRDGASEHDDERDGPWSHRRADAFRARWEWLPVRRPDADDPERVWQKVDLGGLVDLFLIETRSRRDAPVLGEAMSNPSRSALGPDQRAWLLDGLAASTARWRIIGNPSVMAQTWSPHLPPETLTAMKSVKLVSPDGTACDHDQWDGYPAERDALLVSLRESGVRNVVVLSGDVHVGMASELEEGAVEVHEDPVAVELVTASLTSQNADDKLGWSLRTEALEVEAAVMGVLPHVRFLDLDSHGYLVVDITEDEVRGDWWFVDGVLDRGGGQRHGATWTVAHGTARLVEAT